MTSKTQAKAMEAPTAPMPELLEELAKLNPEEQRAIRDELVERKAAGIRVDAPPDFTEAVVARLEDAPRYLAMVVAVPASADLAAMRRYLRVGGFAIHEDAYVALGPTEVGESGLAVIEGLAALRAARAAGEVV